MRTYPYIIHYMGIYGPCYAVEYGKDVFEAVRSLIMLCAFVVNLSVRANSYRQQ